MLSWALDQWRAQLGDAGVIPGQAAEDRYGVCTIGGERSILAALCPRRAEEVVALVRIAGEARIPLYPISTGHNWGYGSALPATDGCVIVDLSGLDRIIDFDPALGLVTLEPGVTQGQLRDYLDRHQFDFLVPVTGAGPNCSLLGNALERGYGITPFADHFGAVTSLEAVLPDGRIYRSALSELGGGDVDRAFKWGVGPYLDGLFAQGNFGIVTQMTIALAPRPEKIQAFFFGIDRDENLASVVTAIQHVLRATAGMCGSINLMNARRVLAMMVPYPNARVGPAGILPLEVIAELAGQNQVMTWTGVGALYGGAAMVRAARREVRRILKPVARRLLFFTPQSTARLNRLIRYVPGLGAGRIARAVSTIDASLQLIAGYPSQIALPLAYWRSPAAPLLGRDLDPARDGCGLIWYPPLVPMKPERVRCFVDMVKEICGSHRIEPLITLTSLSDRCFDSSIPLLFARDDAEQAARAKACYRALLEAGQKEGFLPYRFGIDAMGWLTQSGGVFWDVVSKIKTAIDPNGIIAPGRYSP
jgi:4-cresol dehydrogenase (hydroxylating)